MHSKTFFWSVGAWVLGLALATSAAAQDWPGRHYRGVINDYPLSANPTAGPWELRGPWSLSLQPFGKADFSASLTMEFSDLASATGFSTDSRHHSPPFLYFRSGSERNGRCSGKWRISLYRASAATGLPRRRPGPRDFEHHAGVYQSLDRPITGNKSFRTAADPRGRSASQGS